MMIKIALLDLFPTRTEKLLFGGLVACAIAASAVALNTDLRDKAVGALRPAHRQILSTVTADILKDGGKIKIVKLQTERGLSIEVYNTPDQNGLAPLIERIDLSEWRDAFVNFKGNATRIALQDVDGDTRPEILVPAFDSDLVARIHVFRVSPETHKIEVVSN